MVEWLRHKDGGKMWFRRDKSQASGMIGVINVVFILQPENANQAKRAGVGYSAVLFLSWTFM